MTIRYSHNNIAWWNGDTVDMVEDRYTHKYQLVVKANDWKSDWCDTPDLALQNYNSNHNYPNWEVPQNPGKDWYTGNQEDDEELIAYVLEQEQKYNAMTKEEKIADLKERIAYIEMSTDYMTQQNWNSVHKLEAQIKELEGN